jgi:hypothetical protein
MKTSILKGTQTGELATSESLGRLVQPPVFFNQATQYILKHIIQNLTSKLYDFEYNLINLKKLYLKAYNDELS